MFRSFVYLMLSAALAAGQSFTGPVTAWYFSSSERSLTVIAGYPGSASLGATMLKDVDSAVAAPGCRQALIRRGSEWSLYPNELNTPLIAAERVAWSADGETALLAGNGQYQLIRSGRLTPAQPLPAGRLTAVAVSAKGTWAAVAVDDVLYRVTKQNELQTAQALTVSALAFAGDALYALRAGQVVRLSESGAAEPVAEVAGALGLTADGAGRLMVIAGGEVALVERDGPVRRKSTDAPVAAWQPGCHGDHIVLESAHGEVSVFRSGEHAGIFFVPARSLAGQEEN